jgi:hypothetical protein
MIREDSSLLGTTYVGVLIIGITKAVMLISERPLVWKPTLDPTTFTNFYF